MSSSGASKGGVLRRIELDLRQRVLQVRQPPLGRHVGAAEALAAPFGDRVQRRVLQKLRAAPFDPGVRRVGEPGMKFFDQARFAQARLADDHHQLAVALPRPLPAPHQHRDFFVAADQRREIALRRPASAAARPHEPEQRHRLGHALERVRAALLRDKQACDLALHPRRDQDRARLGQRLHPRRNVGDVAINLARRIDHRRAGFEADAGDERWLAGAGILAVQFSQRALDRERRPRRALGVVLMRHRIAEQRHQPVAELLGDMAAHLRHRRRSGIEIGADKVAPFLGIELRGNPGRADQIAEHHGEIAALADSLGSGRNSRWRRGSLCRSGRMRESFGWRLFLVRITAQRSDGVEQRAAVPDKADAQILQVLRRQARQDLLVDRIVAECSLDTVRGRGSAANRRCPSSVPCGSCQRQFLKRVKSWRPR